MIEVILKIWRFAGAERGNIGKSVLVSFLNAVFRMFEVSAVYFVIAALTSGKSGGGTAWLALALMLVSIVGSAVTGSVSKMQQTHAGYFMAANERIKLGSLLKGVPMGFFGENSLGEVTGVCTTVLGNIEMYVPMVLVNIMSGLIGTLVFTVMIIIFEWRVGLIAAAGITAYFFIVSAMEKKSAAAAPSTHKAQTALTAAVLEYVRGMGVVKSFNLSGKGDKALQNALEYSRKSSLENERVLTPYTVFEELVLQIAAVAMTLISVISWANGAMPLANALMCIVTSFLVFGQVKLFGMGMSMMRLASASIDRVLETENMEQMDENGEEISPKTHEIEFQNVRFSYENKEILHDISLIIPDKTTTAIIGPSGSGKTTLCNLIARFWDADSGSVMIGGRDVRDYTLESLMSQISMVFQNVYLFADTIENNIKFGCPNASHEEVVQAAKRACCAEFIEALPDGYDTVIGEGGADLSGGERQRISIARAMLKDASIVILDEATANVDPENEDKLQKAIEELTRDKTIIMIAHRLKTVRNANQILVVDNGSIVQRGRHEELIGQSGIYADFVTGRREAAGWKFKV
ncbi:MAG: ABC transporter ATP-binding protein/permease [Lachnospiraceae bacterium]|nr:ABC transporter ATP-binding protein/permease [Ruminococcus sp.]MCM1276305.1 ABC transporter ATP-binding protein/permease [Lachnospiraceae bacterium]